MIYYTYVNIFVLFLSVSQGKTSTNISTFYIFLDFGCLKTIYESAANNWNQRVFNESVGSYNINT